MRICMVAYAFYESDTRIMQYTKALVQRGDVVDVLALRKPGATPFEVLNGVNVHRIQTREVNERGPLTYLYRILRFLILASFILARRQFSRRYQVIHVHSVPDFLVFAALVPKLLGTKVVLDVHDLLPEFYAAKFGCTEKSLVFRLLLLVERICSSFSDHVIIANDLWRERLIRRSVSPGKCTAFVNYPDPDVFYPRSSRRHDRKFLILYPGTLNYHQGIDVAIQAFARVADKMPAAEFHVYGEGPEKHALMAMTRDLGLTERMFFHDFIPVRDIAEVMSQADLAVVPKRASSGFGNEAASTKIMEFMSLGVPLAVSRTKIDTFYHDDSRVKFFTSEDVDDLAETMLLLWREPAIRKQLVAKASEYVRENCWLTKKHEYLHLLDGLNPEWTDVRRNEARA
jgi:glycosyltransferase involved in cell wall biosynthesis